MATADTKATKDSLEGAMNGRFDGYRGRRHQSNVIGRLLLDRLKKPSHLEQTITLL